MKSAILALGTLLSLVAAQAPVIDPPAGADWYHIKTKSDINTLSNLYLSSKDGKIGAYAGSRESADVAAKFFTTAYSGSGTLSIHPGDLERQVALSGKDGLLNLVDLKNPSAESIAADTPTEWSVFAIGRGGDLEVKDGREIPGKWVVYLETDGNYYVGYWDGATKQPRTVSNATLIAEKTTAPINS